MWPGPGFGRIRRWLVWCAAGGWCPAGRLGRVWSVGAAGTAAASSTDQVARFVGVSDADRAELLELSEAWMRAVQAHDAEALEQLVAPGFRFMAIHLAPEPLDREWWMDAALTRYELVSFSFLDAEVVVHGDTAIVHSRYSQIAYLDTNDLSHDFRLTDVWARRDGRWQVLARHSSVLG
jgi:ketosteroid isomerase-like protein